MAKIWVAAHYEMPLEKNGFLPPGNIENSLSVLYLKGNIHDQLHFF